ncbi:hypothetical protein AAMO2058_000919400 [Amorphochlora amoebiformis]
MWGGYKDVVADEIVTYPDLDILQSKFSSAPMAAKILVCGDLHGCLNKAFKKADKINKAHGPFDAILCVGTSLSNPTTGASDIKSYVSGERKAPLPTYFLAGKEHESTSGLLDSIPDGGEIAPGLRYLGRSGVAEISGLRIGYISGFHDKMYYKNRTPSAVRAKKYQSHFEEEDVLALLKAATETKEGIDILLTNEWGNGSSVVAEIAMALAPRYHFAATEQCFYKLKPYRNSEAVHVTRFIALGNMGNPDKKQKYLYALNAKPLKAMADEEKKSRPADCTLCPYDYVSVKRPSEISGDSGGPLKRIKLQKVDLKSLEKTENDRFSGDYGGAGQAWRWSAPARGRGRGKGRGRGRGRGRSIPQLPRRMDCWFCLASPKVEEHLIVSVGNECYVAMAKGPLVDDHLLILPVGHVSTPGGLSKEQVSEIKVYEEAMQKYFSSKGNEMLLWERHLPSKFVSHVHFQTLPVAKRYVKVALEGLIERAKTLGLEFKTMPKGQMASQVVGNQYFIRFRFGNGGDTYIATVDPSADLRPLFPLVRRAVAEAIGQPGKSNWKACLTNKQHETDMVNRVKAKFEKFEPEMDDDED